jgi:hypothetical protein
VIKDQLPPAYPSLRAAYREMVPALWKQRRDASYMIERSVPMEEMPEGVFTMQSGA